MKIESKYQKKTLEEVEFNLEDTTCFACHKVFMVDFYWVDTRRLDDGDDGVYYEITCPYCGKKSYLAI